MTATLLLLYNLLFPMGSKTQIHDIPNVAIALKRVSCGESYKTRGH